MACSFGRPASATGAQTVAAISRFRGVEIFRDDGRYHFAISNRRGCAVSGGANRATVRPCAACSTRVSPERRLAFSSAVDRHCTDRHRGAVTQNHSRVCRNAWRYITVSAYSVDCWLFHSSSGRRGGVGFTRVRPILARDIARPGVTSSVHAVIFWTCAKPTTGGGKNLATAARGLRGWR